LSIEAEFFFLNDKYYYNQYEYCIHAELYVMRYYYAYFMIFPHKLEFSLEFYFHFWDVWDKTNATLKIIGLPAPVMRQVLLEDIPKIE
jgi:hypothetical protein